MPITSSRMLLITNISNLMKYAFRVFLTAFFVASVLLPSLGCVAASARADFYNDSRDSKDSKNDSKNYREQNAGYDQSLLEDSITDLIAEKVLDKRVTFELNFNSTDRTESVRDKVDRVREMSLEKFDPKFSSFRVKIIYNDGQIDSLSGRYFSFIEIPVAAKYIKYGDIISRNDIAMQRVRVDQIKRGFATEAGDVLGLKAKKPISPNNMFRMSDLLNPPVIKNNDPVNIIYKSGAISLKTTGTALSSGAVGDTIKVKNDSSGAVLLGEIINKNTVNVGGN